jgi:hypothetical protein
LLACVVVIVVVWQLRQRAGGCLLDVKHCVVMNWDCFDSVAARASAAARDG